MKYVVFHTHGEGLVMPPDMVDHLKALPDVLDVREVPLWSMQPEFWRGLETAIAQASMTEGCEFVCWGPADRYGNCPVRVVECSSFGDVESYCEGLRPTVTERRADGTPMWTTWAKPDAVPA